MNGKFIVIEGLDGSGKTTQADIITRKLTEKGINVVRTAEPTDGVYGKLCREYLAGRPCPKTLFAATFTADRIDHNKNPENGIEMHIEKGDTVISDRYYYSSLAYQGVDVDTEWVRALNIDCEDIRTPDLCIFLDLTPEISMKRITSNRKAEDIEIYETEEYLTSIRKRFYEAIDMLKDDENIVIVDASGTVEEVAAEIEKAVMQLY